MWTKAYAVYMMTNTRRGVLYTGMTSDLPTRGLHHREGSVEGFTRTWSLRRLVWYETHIDVYEAIAREKRIKRWRRAWKFALVEAVNPAWTDLWPELMGYTDATELKME